MICTSSKYAPRQVTDGNVYLTILLYLEMNLANLHNQIITSISALIGRLVGIALTLYGTLRLVTGSYTASKFKQTVSQLDLAGEDFKVDQYLVSWITFAALITILGVFMTVRSHRIGGLLCKGILIE